MLAMEPAAGRPGLRSTALLWRTELREGDGGDSVRLRGFPLWQRLQHSFLRTLAAPGALLGFSARHPFLAAASGQRLHGGSWHSPGLRAEAAGLPATWSERLFSGTDAGRTLSAALVAPRPDQWLGKQAQAELQAPGLDGVVELALTHRRWWANMLQTPSRSFNRVQASEFNLTESGLRSAAWTLASTACVGDFASSPAPTARAPVQEAHSSESPAFLHMEATGAGLAASVGKWPRMVARLHARALWHVRGVLYCGFCSDHTCGLLPFPYPSVSSPAAWKQQAESMLSRGLMTRKCFNGLAWTAGNLHEVGWLRNRLGLCTAFLEDPLVEGMLAAKKAKGASVRAAVLQEKKNEAKADAERLGREEAVRTTLGLRGGLPTLKADLLKLAALLRVEIARRTRSRPSRRRSAPWLEHFEVTTLRRPRRRHQARGQRQILFRQRRLRPPCLCRRLPRHPLL